jgi:nicotinate-nucleotide--dimethylbenzimidazole phosphoribosyltransferase
MSEVVGHVVASIGPASAAHAEAARRNVAGAAAPLLEQLAGLLGGAQHTPRPRAGRRRIVVCAADADTVRLGPAHPTVIAATAIADGSAALAHVARTSKTPIVLIDAGVADRDAMPSVAIELAAPDARLGLEAGIALAVSLADDGLDLLAIGAIGTGWDRAAAELLRAPEVHHAGAAVLAGLVLGAASMDVPTILDGEATGAAALVAARVAPAVTGYLVAAHRGGGVHPRILAVLGAAPIFDVGLGHGEGTGAAMLLPWADQVAALVAGG